ncbi:hypothetical protein I4F81_012327 [Pyropia yezoensis]|uniref:Uncharacterized protein n=1 Tax=Pyropia yezoensis TaxID=2788 RepID=A0ACC3CJD5_PYRYE|nr:hypothetical protein I4F81_012327 [Neopyropia yezoensis]
MGVRAAGIRWPRQHGSVLAVRVHWTAAVPLRRVARRSRPGLPRLVARPPRRPSTRTQRRGRLWALFFRPATGGVAAPAAAPPAMAAVAPVPHRLYLEEELTQDGDGAAGGAAAGTGGATATAGGARSVGADDDASDDDVHLGAVACSIVGMRYYQGVVHQGEWVELVREPSNPYDANAIRVENMARVQVGHISRGEAFYLAPFMDESPATRLRLLATLPSRPRSKFRCPVRIDFFGPPERQERLATRLDTAMEYTSPEDCDGIGAAGAQEGEPAPVEGPPAASAGRRSAAVAARATLAATVASRTSAPRGGAGAGQSAADLDRLFDDAAASRAASLAAAGAALRPPPSLAAVLFPHQAAGVAWALARETAPADSVPPFWSTAVEGGRDVWFNSLTNSSAETMAETGTATPSPAKAEAKVEPDTLAAVESVAAPTHPPSDVKEEVKAEPGALAIEPTTTNPVGRARTRRQSRSASIGVPAATCPPSDSAPAAVQVLSRTAVRQLKVAALRAALVARGVQTADELAALRRPALATLLEEHEAAWETQLADLVAPGVLRVTVYHGAGRTTDVAALAENDVIVASYGTLASEWSPDAADDATGDGRRPPARKKRKSGAAAAHAGVLARVPLRRLVLDEAHILRNGERTRLFKAVMALNAPLRWALTGTPVVNRADDLQPLLAWLRVAPLESRRVWNRAISLPLSAGDEAGLARLRTVVGNAVTRLFAMLAGAVADSDRRDCAVCMEVVTDESARILTRCRHTFCEACLATLLQLGRGFTSFLDLLERSLTAAGWRRGTHFVRLDGSVSRPARAAALGRLRDAPSCRLLLASLTAGGVGISLVAANRVVLADPWWNAAAEAQAADRVCRLGQRRRVTVVKLVMEASVEAAMCSCGRDGDFAFAWCPC